ncbi:uncharacterized protein LOC144943039 [Lampetra fluviatilis]
MSIWETPPPPSLLLEPALRAGGLLDGGGPRQNSDPCGLHRPPNLGVKGHQACSLLLLLNDCGAMRELRTYVLVAGFTLHDRVRISVIWESLRVEPLLLRMKRSQLRWFGHLSFGGRMRGAAVPTDPCFPATPGSSVSVFESEEFIDRDNGDDRGGAPKGLSRGPVRGVVAAALVIGAAAPGRALGTAPRQPERRRCGWSHRVRAKSSRESGPGRQFASPLWMP